MSPVTLEWEERLYGDPNTRRMTADCSWRYQLQQRKAAVAALNEATGERWHTASIATTGEMLGELANLDLLVLV